MHGLYCVLFIDYFKEPETYPSSVCTRGKWRRLFLQPSWCLVSGVRVSARGQLSGQLLAGKMTLSPDSLTSSPNLPPPLRLLSFTDDPPKWLTRLNFLYWFRRALCCTIICLHGRPNNLTSFSGDCWRCCDFKQICLPLFCYASAIKKISRQSACLPLHSSTIKLVQSITWAYWLESSAVERAVYEKKNQCFIFS